jgi:hypothetical protein
MGDRHFVLRINKKLDDRKFRKRRDLIQLGYDFILIWVVVMNLL